MRRLHQVVLIISTILLSWLGMMIVHEGGHVIGAWLTGDHVRKVVLHPLVFSRTDLSRNVNPLIVAWAGPILGSMLPAAAYLIASALGIPGAYVLRFFAGFCLIANGAYIGAGSINRVGDTYDMLLFGPAHWQLWLFGALAMTLGLMLWHRLGPDFGLGPDRRSVSPAVAYAVCGVLLLVIAAELAFGKNG